MSEAPQRSATILLIEDDPSDRKLIRRFFENSSLRNEIQHVRDGEEALDYLYRQGDYVEPEEAPWPDLVLLDLNLPRVDGREVLETMKEDPDLRSLPVVVLTTSEEEEDIHRSYNLGASSYIVKPMDMDQFAKVVDALENYWFDIVVLPDEVDDAPDPQSNEESKP